MKHFNHKIISFGISALAGADIVGVLGALAGSTLPDLDIPLGIPHRTITHWWPIYTGAGIAVKFLPTGYLPPLVTDFVFWVCVGSLLHIIEDSLTVGGIPVLGPFSKKRFSFMLTRTGGMLEYLVSLAVIASIIGVISFKPHYFSFDGQNIKDYVQGIAYRIEGQIGR